MPTGLFGRGDELRILTGALYTCRQGTGRVVVIAGPAGIGKSSLCVAARDRFAAFGALILQGVCPPDVGAEIAYAPFVAAWRDSPDDSFGELLGGLAALGPISAGIARAWLADRVLGQLAKWSAERPVVLIVEDLQWIDASSRALLDMLARAAAQLRLLIIVTARDEQGPASWIEQGAACWTEQGPACWTELASLPHARAMALGPLPAPAARALARMVGGAGVDVGSVLRRGEGHPLFTVELARWPGPDLPPTLHTLLAGRVRELGNDGVRLLAAVALAGESARPDICLAVAGRRLFNAAIERGLIVVDRRADRVRLRHGLFGEMARGGLAPATARRLYRQVAVALDGGATPAAVLARLWAGAGQPERARAAWLVAGGQAALGHAYQEAALAYRQAIAIRSDGAAVLCAADALRWAGHLDAALEQARCGLAGLPPSDAQGRALLLDGMRRYLYAAGRAAEAFDVLREARAAAARQPSATVTATIEVAEAGRLLVLGRYEQGVTACERAAALLADGPAAQVRALAASTEGMCRAMLGQLDRGLALLRDAQLLAAQDGAVRVVARVAANHAYVLANASRYGECVRVCRGALDRLGGPAVADALGGSLRYNMVAALVALGRWDEAERECAVGSATPRIRVLLLACRATLDARRGGSRAPALLAEATLVDRESPGVAAEVGYAEAVLASTGGQHRAAVSRSRAMLADGDLIAAPGDRLRLLAVALGALADLQLCRGRVRRFDDPGVVADELVVQCDKALAGWPPRTMPAEIELLGIQCAAEAARLRPIAEARISGRQAEASVSGRLAETPVWARLDEGSVWGRLAERWAELAMPYQAGYARLRCADALVDRGRPDAAGPWLREAYDEAVRLGAVPLRREVERVARRARAPLPGGTDGGPTLDILTRREREVLDLVAFGRTNREIAEQLVISERTAGVHVSRVLAKLGAGNRAEAAHLARLSPTAGAGVGARVGVRAGVAVRAGAGARTKDT